MNARLRASLSPLLASITGERGVISLKPKLSVFSSFPFEVQGLSRSLHESADEDDEYSELGLPLEQRTAKGRPLRLRTEKVDFFKKIVDNGRKNSKSASSTVKGNTISKLLSEPRTSNGHVKLEDTLSATEGASSLSKRGGHDESDENGVEEERSEPSGSPMPKGQNSNDYPQSPIHTSCLSKSSTVRISNICAETSDTALDAICSSFGPLLELVRTEESIAYAVFSSNEADIPSILERLNYTIMDNCNWSAELQPEDPAPAATKIKGGDDSILGLKILARVHDLEKEITLRKLYCEDFTNLHQAIMRLESLNAKFPDTDRDHRRHQP